MELEIVPVLVQLLGRTEEASMLLKVVTCLQLLTAENGKCRWTEFVCLPRTLIVCD